MKTKIVDLEELARELKKNPNLKGKPTCFRSGLWLFGMEIISGLTVGHLQGKFEIQVEPEVIEFECAWRMDDGQIIVPFDFVGKSWFELQKILIGKKTKVRVEILDE